MDETRRGGRWEGRFWICFDQRKGWRVMTWKLFEAALTSSLHLPVSLQHSAVLYKLVHLSSDVQRLQTSPAHSCPKFFFNRWISPQCLQANWLYLGCSLLRPQPSLLSFYSYHFEEVHRKFPPGQEVLSLYQTPPAVKLVAVSAGWSELLQGFRSSSSHMLLLPNLFYLLIFFPFESVMWSQLNVLGHVSNSRGFESWNL